MRFPGGWVLAAAAAAALAVAASVDASWTSRLGSVTGARGSALPVAVRAAFELELDRLGDSLDSLAEMGESGDRRRARLAFRRARLDYKRAECLLAAYSPPTVSALNGPAVESDGDSPPPPLGTPAEFQRIEAVLFASDTAEGAPTDRSAVRSLALAMRDQVRTLRASTNLVSVSEPALLDAVRAEVARVSTLGIAGVDLDRGTDVAIESAAALEGMLPLVSVASALASGSAATQAWNDLAAAIRRAGGQLRGDPGFARADRLAFLAGDMGAVTRALGRVRAALPPSKHPLRRSWRSAAASVFDSGAFAASAYAPEYAPASSAALVALGKRLFFDARLSGPRTRSCATCHVPSRAFTDGRARSLTLTSGAQATARNTPTLINAALEPALFADQRAGSLEEQVARVLASPAEMRSSAEEAASRIGADSSYRAEFRHAVGGRSDSAVTALGVRVALAAYVRSLVALDSRFDRAVRGDTGALTASERRGFDLFAGRARCGTCHFMPLFSGVAPPEFVTSEPEIIGVPAIREGRPSRLDPDPGRAAVDHAEAHRYAFRVPTLRNVALTAPYMHNGVFRSLEEVVEFYDRGGGAGAGLRVPGQTLNAKPLHLSAGDRRDLVAFLRTLTDTIVPAVP